MLYYIVSSFIMIHFITQNVGPIYYNLVRLFSKIQLMICPPPPPHKTSGNSLDLLMNSSMICEYHVDNAFNWINLSEFAVLKSGKHRICFYPPIESYIPEYEPSQVQFISSKINIDSTEYTLRLQTPEYSFYVVHNEINVDFVRYYFIKYHNMVLPVDVEYVITIIDDNVKFITFDQKQILVFEPTSYLVYNPEDEHYGEEKEDDQEDGEDDDQEDGEDDDQEDEDDVGLDRMIEIGEEIEAEKAEDIPLTIDDLEMEKIILDHESDLEIDKFIAEYDMTNIVMFDK